ncbi:enoyl-CoA hydratase/isomerase family protein [Euzebya sp.]|uniref:enoyl-CoA hydratase/isomerase family protein n=1 Tax=Euzebya sp. TaxID=1971409 RepID=UPI0035156222
MYDELPPEVEVRADGPVRVVTMQRPEHLNAVDEAMHDGLVAVWGRLAADAEARSVVLTGAGSAFSAGGDFDWIAEINASDARASDAAAGAAALITAMLGFPLPVVAAVNGPAVGLGCSLTVMSDIVVMSADAHLADPHVAVGLVAGDGGALWPSLTSMHIAKEFLFLGRRLPAEEASRHGLANRVVPADQVLDEAMDLARRLADLPPQAVQDTKRTLNTQLLAGWPAIELGVTAERASMRSAAHIARIAALRDGRG